jgi:curved DNA-binding protein CbpA
MKNRRNYYRILHVQPDAPAAVIKASYRTLMQRLKMHPDLGGDHARAALMNEALATLADPEKRAAYDRTLARTGAQQRGASGPAAPNETPTAPGPRAARARNAAACCFCGAPSPAIDDHSPESVCVTCGSALFPARKHQAGDASRRAIERVPRNMPLTFFRSASRETVWSGITEDVSLNGMRFFSPRCMSIGERLRIECDFCSAVAIVRSIRRDGDPARSRWECGVEFLTLHIKRRRGGLISTVA